MNGLNLKSAVAGAVLIAIVAIVSLQSDDSSEFKFTLGSEVEFDIYNATFETCVTPSDQDAAITFSNKTWVDPEWVPPPKLDPDLSFDEYLSLTRNYNYDLKHQAVISSASVEEVVEQSPGPEVLATIRCFWGESGFEERVQIFAGNVPEAKQLGRHLLGYLFEVTAYGEIGVKHDKYTETRPPCCFKEYTFSYYSWRDNDWHESTSENGSYGKLTEGEF